MFKQTMVNLRSALLAIAPAIKDIEQFNNLLDRGQQQIELLKKQMKAGTKLVHKCSKVHRLNCLARARYQEQLEELEESLVMFSSSVMLLQMARDQMETLFTVQRIYSNIKKFRFPVSSVSNPEIREGIDGAFAYMITARNLRIAGGDTDSYWRWTSVRLVEASSSESESEVAEFLGVCWLDIGGKIKTSMLSPNTLYEAFFVFKHSSAGAFGFDKWVVEVSVKVTGEGDVQKRMVYLKPATQPRLRHQIVTRILNHIHSRFLDSSDASTLLPVANSWPEAEYSKQRDDGWMEAKLGDFSSYGAADKDVEMRLREVNSNVWKGRILVQGIELRPKLNN